MFRDRIDAGQKLAKRLEPEYRGVDAVVLAIPRGGVVVGNEVAKTLSLPLDVIIPRKIGAPGNPELAIGAVAHDKAMINESLVAQMGIPSSYIDQEVKRQLGEIDRRRKLYMGEREPIPLEGKIAIIVDDGLATGYTALAAIDAVRHHHPQKIVLAVPVAPRDTCDRFQGEVDEVICLEAHEIFFAVGQFYESFEQTTDSEVVAILKSYREGAA